MKNIMDKHTIITLKKAGQSNRKIYRDTGIDRKTIARYWDQYLKQVADLDNFACDQRRLQEKITSEPKYDTSNRKPRRYTEQINSLVDEILLGEKEKCILLGEQNKQKLSSVQIHEIVLEKGYDIGLTTLTAKIRLKREKAAECFIRQEYEFADRLEYDFGEVRLIIGGAPHTYYLAVLSSPASGARWAYLYENQKKDVFMDSHVRFFEMIGGVYKEVVYDNMKNVVTKFIGHSEKILNEDLIKMSLYYGFRVNVTNCFSGNEKGHVEGSVKVIRNRVFARKYKFENMEAAEEHLAKTLKTINQNSSFSEEKNHLLAYRAPLELAKLTSQKVDKYSFIRVENNFYSVPEYLVGREVTVKNYLKEILIYSAAELVCRHKKIDGFHEMAVDIYHYLDTFQKKPGALKNSLALKSKSQLKTIYDQYFTTRTREFIEILKENVEKDMTELVKICKDASLDQTTYRSAVPDKIEDNISRHTKNQITEISKLFMIGGTDIVN